MNIHVTGGAGYIGSHLCKALAAKGYVPITYDNLSRGNVWAVKWGPLEKADIADGQRLHTVLEKYRPRALMHFAAYAYVGESVEQPLLYYRNNFAGTAALLQTVADFHCIPIVFSSSCTTYGLPERVPIAEDHPQRPINPVATRSFSSSGCWRISTSLAAYHGSHCAISTPREQIRMAKSARGTVPKLI